MMENDMTSYTKYNIGDRVWFFEKGVGEGIVDRIDIRICIEKPLIPKDTNRTIREEKYDIRGLYATGIESGILHKDVPEYYVHSTKEDLYKYLSS